MRDWLFPCKCKVPLFFLKSLFLGLFSVQKNMEGRNKSINNVAKDDKMDIADDNETTDYKYMARTETFSDICDLYTELMYEVPQSYF